MTDATSLVAAVARMVPAADLNPEVSANLRADVNRLVGSQRVKERPTNVEKRNACRCGSRSILTITPSK